MRDWRGDSKPEAGQLGGCLAPLRDPRWLGALALLVVNDWVLKPLAGAGLFPAWLAGKLSDFAGLIVAPILVACVLVRLGVRSHTARIVGMSSVVALFVAVNVSAELTGTLDAALIRAGIPIRNWSDQTDLAALLVLPLAWRILDRPRPLALPRLDWLGAFLGAIACLATSWGGPGDPLSPAIGNVTNAEIVVTAQPLDIELSNCLHQFFPLADGLLRPFVGDLDFLGHRDPLGGTALDQMGIPVHLHFGAVHNPGRNHKSRMTGSQL